MIFELSQRFFFDAAHTLNRKIDAASSRRIHGHTYQAEVTVQGLRSEDTGMVCDLAVLRRAIAVLRDDLDHRLLDEVPGLSHPTLENLCAFIAARLQKNDLPIASVKVWRDASGDSCLLRVAPAP